MNSKIDNFIHLIFYTITSFYFYKVINNFVSIKDSKYAKMASILGAYFIPNVITLLIRALEIPIRIANEVLLLGLPGNIGAMANSAIFPVVPVAISHFLPRKVFLIFIFTTLPTDHSNFPRLCMLRNLLQNPASTLGSEGLGHSPPPLRNSWPQLGLGELPSTLERRIRARYSLI